MCNMRGDGTAAVMKANDVPNCGSVYACDTQHLVRLPIEVFPAHTTPPLGWLIASSYSFNCVL